MKPLCLRLFGGFHACDVAERKITILGTKAALLLAYLALKRGLPQSRDVITGLLWSDRGDAQARGSLRQALWSLCRALKKIEPNPLIIEGDTIALDQTVIETDVASFERLLANPTPDALSAAVELYRGELLHGVRIRDPVFEDFLRGECARLNELAVIACTDLLNHQLRGAPNAQTAATAKRLLEIDPFQELAHQTLMRHYVSKGQLSLAIRQYQTCRDIFRRELNVNPGVETEQLFERIRHAHSADETVMTAPDRKIGDHHGDRSLGPQIEERPAISVLPFVNLSGDPEQEYFSDGIAEDIITALSRLRWFLVIARNSSFIYKGKAVDVRQIGRELNVRYVLEGSIRKAGNRVRINAQLIDAISGNHIWADKYDRQLDDIFALQDEITQSVTAAIEPKLVAAEGSRSTNRRPQDLDAWGLVSRAMARYWRMTTGDSDAAIEMLREAVQRYPDYGPAHSLLAFALLVSGHVGWNPESEDDGNAANLAHRAIELDREDPWAHLALGYLAFTKRQTEDSVREFMQALDLNPNFSTAFGYLGWALVFDGRSEEAIGYFQQALRMSPYDPFKAFYCSGTCVAHYYARRYEEAIEWGRKAIGERPGFTAAQRILCASLAQAGRIAETDAAMSRLREIQPNISIAWIKQHVPYTARAMPHFLDGMRKAGLD